VTQLALLLVLGLFGSLLAFVLVRLELTRGAVPASVKRAEGALERASATLLRVASLRALTLLLVPALGLAAFAGHGDVSRISAVGRAVFSVLALMAGALTALLQARFALALGVRAASAAATARARGSALTLRPLLRAAVATSVWGEGLGLLGLTVSFASLYAVRGGFASAQPSAELASDIAKLLPAFALGAAVTALSIAREGSVAGAAARVGGARTTEPEAGLAPSDPRDPALLAQLVGNLVGELLPNALTSFACGVVATTSVAVWVASGGPSGALASLVLVVLVRAFGGVASVCGVLAARVTDEEPASRALVRGQSSALVVALVGLGAALFWLMREHWGALFVAGAAGACSTTLVSLGAGLRLGHFSRVADGRRDASFIVRGLGAGFTSAWPSLLIPALALASVEHGLASHASAGALLVSFVAGALSLTPFAVSLQGFGVLTQHTRGVVALLRMEEEGSQRASKLEEASALGRAAGSTYTSLALGASLLLGLAAASPALATGTLGIGAGVLAVTVGLALMTAFGSATARSAVSGARLVATEVEEQRRATPADAAPSYKSSLDASLEAARAVPRWELGLTLACPFALAGLLRFSAVPSGDAAFRSFGVTAVTAALVVALGARATRARLTEAPGRTRSVGALPLTHVQAESFGDLVGVPVAASVEALALVLALIVLCLAPLLR
jgi:K(+)-stimulated pyrophosphate-energized sodium pump